MWSSNKKELEVREARLNAKAQELDEKAAELRKQEEQIRKQEHNASSEQAFATSKLADAEAKNRHAAAVVARAQEFSRNVVKAMAEAAGVTLTDEELTTPSIVTEKLKPIADAFTAEKERNRQWIVLLAKAVGGGLDAEKPEELTMFLQNVPQILNDLKAGREKQGEAWAELARMRSALTTAEKELKERENEQATQAATIERQKGELSTRQGEVERLQNELRTKQEELNQSSKALEISQKALEDQQKSSSNFAAAQLGVAEEKMRDARAAQADAERLQTEVEARRQEVQVAEAKVAEESANLHILIQENLATKEIMEKERREVLAAKDALQERERAVSDRETSVGMRENRVGEREGRVATDEANSQLRLEELGGRERSVAQREANVAAREADTEAREEILEHIELAERNADAARTQIPQLMAELRDRKLVKQTAPSPFVETTQAERTPVTERPGPVKVPAR